MMPDEYEYRDVKTGEIIRGDRLLGYRDEETGKIVPVRGPFSLVRPHSEPRQAANHHHHEMILAERVTAPKPAPPVRTQSVVLSELRAGAKQLREADPTLTEEQAFVRAMEADPRLYREYYDVPPDEQRSTSEPEAKPTPESRMGIAAAEAMKPIRVEAKRLREADPGLSEEQAFSQAIHRNPKLYDDYRRGQLIDEQVDAKVADFFEQR